jgi:hypothetical protein
MPGEGRTCETCGRTRAPALVECPWCRAAAPAPTNAPKPDADAPFLGPAVIGALLTLPVMWGATYAAAGAGPSDAYVAGEGALDTIAFGIGVVVAIGAYVLSARLERFGIGMPTRIVVAALGVLPLVTVATNQPLHRANHGDTPEVVQCTCLDRFDHRGGRHGWGDVIYTELTIACTPDGAAPFQAVVSSTWTGRSDCVPFSLQLRRGRFVGFHR